MCTDVWQGSLHGNPVGIKALRIYPARHLKEAKEVSMCVINVGVYSGTRFTDFVETGADVEEAIP